MQIYRYGYTDDAGHHPDSGGAEGMAGRRIVSYGGAVGGDRSEGDSGVDGFHARAVRSGVGWPFGVDSPGPVPASCAILEVHVRARDDRWWIADGPASGVPGGHGWRCVSRREIAERFWDVERRYRLALPPPEPGSRVEREGFAFDFVGRRVVPLPRGTAIVSSSGRVPEYGRPIRAAYVFASPDRDTEPEKGDVT